MMFFKIKAPILIALGFLEPIQCQIHFTLLKDVDEFTDHPGASITYGYIAWKKYLGNRRFLGNYGDSSRGFFCGSDKSEIGQLLRQNKDCPLDHYSELLQRLFPSQDGDNFTANQVDSDIVSRISPATVGALLQRIARLTELEWSDSNALNRLEDDLKQILFYAINYKKAIESELQSLGQLMAKRRSKLVKRMNRGGRQSIDLEEIEVGDIRRLLSARETIDDGLTLAALYFKKYKGETAAFDRVVESVSNPAITEKLQQEFRGVSRMIDLDRIRNDLKDNQTQQWGDVHQFAEFSSLLVRALEESRKSDSEYPEYLPEQTLIAFALNKGNSRADIMSYLKAMPDLLKPEKRNYFDDPQNVSEFLRNVWTGSALDSIDQYDLSETTPYDVLVALSEFSYERSNEIPPAVQMGQSEHELSPGVVKSYPDCGETSLRNFFNTVVYDKDTRKLDVSILDILEAQNPNIKFDQSLREFYGLYHSTKDVASIPARNYWAYKVVSHREGLVYKKHNVAEIRSLGSMDNMFKLIGQLIFSDTTAYTKIKEALWDNVNREGKLNFLFNTISRPGRVFTWKFDGEDTDLETPNHPEGMSFHISINNEPAFTWSFFPGHFVFSARGGSWNFWSEFLRPSKIIQLAARNRPYFLPIMAIDKFRDIILNELSTNNRFKRTILYSARLSGPDDMAVLFTKILNPYKPDIWERHKEIGADILLMRLLEKVSAVQESYLMKLVYSAIYVHHYPFGYPRNALGHPEAVFDLIPSGDLASRFGPTVAQSLGETWRVDLLGKKVLISDTLITQSNFLNALAACNNLNSADVRDKVLSQLIAREAAIRKLRGEILVYWPKDRKEVVEIYASMPVDGFHLLGIDQLAEINMLMNSKFGFIHQFLPHLSLTWSSSAVLDRSAYLALDQSPYPRSGPMKFMRTDSSCAVRCGYEEHASIIQEPFDWTSIFEPIQDDDDKVRNKFRVTLLGREVIVGDPINVDPMKWSDSWEVCSRLNPDPAGSRRDESERLWELEKVRDKKNHLDKGMYMEEIKRVYDRFNLKGYAMMEADEWEAIMKLLADHPFPGSFYSQFFHPSEGCDFHVSRSTKRIYDHFSCIPGAILRTQGIFGRIKCVYTAP